MFKSLEKLMKYRVHASDGEIGSVDDFFFDDEKWAVRYLVVSTGGFLTRRKVLISPISVQQLDWDRRIVHLALNRQEIENSPDIDADMPVSRQREMDYFEYYRWPYYWTGAGLWGVAPTPLGLTTRGIDESAQSPELRTYPYRSPYEQDSGAASYGDPHLRSYKEIKGYHIEATDRAFGHVEDIIIDSETWGIHYLVIDTVNWWPSKAVLIAPQWVDSISWAQRKVRVSLSEDIIKSSPRFNSVDQLDREYENSLYEHYGRPKYWQRYEVPGSGTEKKAG